MKIISIFLLPFYFKSFFTLFQWNPRTHLILSMGPWLKDPRMYTRVSSVVWLSKSRWRVPFSRRRVPVQRVEDSIVPIGIVWNRLMKDFQEWSYRWMKSWLEYRRWYFCITLDDWVSLKQLMDSHFHHGTSFFPSSSSTLFYNNKNKNKKKQR